MLVDSHCHLDTIDYSNQSLDDVLKRAEENNVQGMLCVCIDMQGFPGVMEVASKRANIHATVGIHPNSSLEEVARFQEVVLHANDDKIIGIGETGLDYYRTTESLDSQRSLFASHIQLAKEVDKPLIIHSREAKKDTIKLMKDYDAKSPRGIMHCFVEDIEMARQSLDLGFYISFSGIVTFKNAHQVQEVAKYAPLDRILIETDSPYLAPIPYRGKSNEPAYVKYVAEKIAELRKDTFENIATQTTNNYYELFKKQIGYN